MISIVFFGSGPVAATALESLSQNFTIEAVVTKPQPEHHKEEFPVLKLAKAKKFKVLIAQNKQQLSDLFKTKPVKSQIGVVIDYGVIVPKDLIDYFPLGIVNSHFSLLPQWRGADPITFALLSGQSKTGVSLMLIDENLDTGQLITQKVLHIQPDDDIDSLTKRLIELSDQLLKDYLPRYISGQVKPHNQPHPDRVTYSRKLTKEDGLIDWTKPAVELERQVKAFKQWPKSYTSLGGKEVIITKARSSNQSSESQPGQIITDNKLLAVQTGDGLLVIERLKPAGKNEMPAKAFLAGYSRQL
ncbi:MAG TPA: methionyl-tRNA formyltransferase [Candidatus Saccharimonadales bacterium]|nr:methionyl-tRNA formyltransferase [Candidatus Saccharimonadales bacterium]